jgi:hypothetical protein
VGEGGCSDFKALKPELHALLLRNYGAVLSAAVEALTWQRELDPW